MKDILKTAILGATLIASFPAYASVADGFFRAKTSFENVARSMRAPSVKSNEEQSYTSTIAVIDDNNAVDRMIEIGCVIFGQRDELVLVCVPDDKIPDFLEIPGILESSAARTCTSTCNVVREYTGVDEVLSYNNTGFDGSGVVLGLSDIGFDAGHPAFAGRVVRFCGYDDTKASSFCLDNEAEILAKGTDDPEQTHATMCANILGGARNSSPYFGMAPGAELVAGTSILHDCGMLAAIDRVIEYARENGKPAVVSLSLASYIGPHDGSDPVCRYLAKQAKEAVIAVSAGNEGLITSTINHVFDDTNSPVLGAIVPTYGGDLVEGYAQIWSDGPRGFTFILRVWDSLQEKFVFSKEICQGNNTSDSELFLGLNDADAALGNYFSGTGVSVSCGIEECNGEFAATLIYSVKATMNGRYPRYILVMDVDGEPGQNVRLFCDSSRTAFTPEGFGPFTPGSSSLAVNDMGSADGVLCVGAMTARKSFSLDNGYSFNITYPYDAVASFSGYSTGFLNVSPLPHVVAPGVGIMSAVSSYVDPKKGYCSPGPDGKEYYWRADDGTSFSTPATAGIIALWQQANPELTPAELIEIAMMSASKELSDYPTIKAGAGTVDALAGLRMALGKPASETNALSPDGREIQILVDGPNVEAYGPEGQVDVSVYSADGRRHSPYNLAPGIYICHSSNGLHTITKRITIK
ncbi:MAG: S8 family serine peptidase [Muribaculaceae bacterium]|nr:S8 family serine peptidase [Muribaculaceae bacterium]